MNSVSAAFSTWRQDLPASLVVFLVALPLCLGIAMASGAPLFSGLIAGIVGGLIVGCISKSPLSVSGPAAGLTVIVLDGITKLPTYEAFLLAVCLAGVFQLALGFFRAGGLGNFVPSYIINGMLAGIGLILILKQIPHALGYDANFEGDEEFMQADGHNTFSAIFDMPFEVLNPVAIFIALVSLAFLFWWDTKQPKQTNWLRYLPGPLAVVAFGIAANWLSQFFAPAYTLGESHLVAVPIANSASEFFGQFRFPDFAYIADPVVWQIAVTLAVVASIESILCVEAIDRLDPLRRKTPNNRELVAQGVGNFASGFVGGMPITSVIVRSSANLNAGARSRLSTFMHGALLLLCVVSIPSILNLIPLSALAAVLIAIGYKLAKPSLFLEKYRRGMRYFVPFVTTVVAIVFTDPLIGIGIGMAFGILFMMIQSMAAPLMATDEDQRYVLHIRKDLFFLHKPQLKKALGAIPADREVVFDVSNINFMDKDNVDLLNEFASDAQQRNVRVSLRAAASHGLARLFTIPPEKMA